MTIERPSFRKVLAGGLALTVVAGVGTASAKEDQQDRNTVFVTGDQPSTGTYQPRIETVGIFNVSDRVSTETMSCLSNISEYTKAWRCSTPDGKIFDTDNVVSAMGRTPSPKGQNGPTR